MSAEGAWAILVAAGSGTRLAASLNGQAKQFMEWRGRPLYWHSVLALARCALIRGITVVFAPECLEAEGKRLEELFRLDDPGIPWLLAPGGATRQQSVRNGLVTIPADMRLVAIHDAARPFLQPQLVWRMCEAVQPPWPGAIPGLEPADTIKILADNSPETIGKTLPRSTLRAVQTPQVFDVATLRRAHEQAERSGLQGTDDATLMEMAGCPVRIVPGDPGNIKITNPADLILLREKTEITPESCNGFGYDAHRYGAGRPLKLGGVDIPGNFEVVAHSDGDVLLHALADAILGCAALGDIGRHFPDADPAYEGISSAIILDHVVNMARERGIKIRHVDLTVIAQKPKLQPYATEIKSNVARLLALAPEHVNFKATTEEGMGFTGRLEGIKAVALVSALKYAQQDNNQFN